MSPKKYKTVPPHFSSWSADFAEEVGNVMQFALSLYKLSPAMSPWALPCMSIAHTSALGVWFLVMHHTIQLPEKYFICLYVVWDPCDWEKSPVYPNKAFLHLL